MHRHPDRFYNVTHSYTFEFQNTDVFIICIYTLHDSRRHHSAAFLHHVKQYKTICDRYSVFGRNRKHSCLYYTLIYLTRDRKFSFAFLIKPCSTDHFSGVSAVTPKPAGMHKNGGTHIKQILVNGSLINGNILPVLKGEADINVITE